MPEVDRLKAQNEQLQRELNVTRDKVSVTSARCVCHPCVCMCVFVCVCVCSCVCVCMHALRVVPIMSCPGWYMLISWGGVLVEECILLLCDPIPVCADWHYVVTLWCPLTPCFNCETITWLCFSSSLVRSISCWAHTHTHL